MSRRAPVTGLAVVLGLVLLLTGCVRLPESGPVVEDAGEVGRGTVPGAFFVPGGPQPGESPADIVRHFMEAMTATPIQTGVAREFLTDSAAAAWEPDRETLTYDGPLRPTGSTEVTVQLPSANRLDQGGTWLGSLPTASSQLRFPMELEDDEWRIGEAPDALVVPETWFEDRFRQVSLYFFDPGAEILVPEPVFVPVGEQLASTLVRRLVDGPGPGRLRDVSRTFLPPGASLELSVTVSASGVAEVVLAGDRTAPDPEVATLQLTQLAWTLRQDPSIDAFRLTVAGEPVTLPDGSSEVPVDFGAEYAPWVSASSNRLFGISDGVVVDVSPGEGVTPVRGPFGDTDLGLGEIAVDMAGDRIVGVTEDGGSVLLGAVDDEDTGVRTVLDGGDDLAKPSWDHAGRLWTLDRTDDGARVVVVEDGTVRELEVPGVTGADVRDLTISRDGSRLVSAVRDAGSDRVVINRVRYRDDGTVDSLSVATTVLVGGEDPLRVIDLAFSSPTALSVVDRQARGTWQVRTVPVDGSLASTDDQAPTSLERQAITRVVAAPESDLPTYVVTQDGATPIGSFEGAGDIVDAVDALTYVG